MFGMNMSVEDAKYFLETQERLADKIIGAVKKYWKENADMICAGFASMNGSYYVPITRK